MNIDFQNILTYCPCLSRPLIIQLILKEAGCVLWLDISYRFTTDDLTPFLERARKQGVLTWPMLNEEEKEGVDDDVTAATSDVIEEETEEGSTTVQEGRSKRQQAESERKVYRQVPTSSLTHPKMFSRLGIRDLEDYNFQHMVALKALLIYNTPEIHSKLMSPWVRCALLDDCIEPIGAQSSGCRFDKKPQYRYSGTLG